MQLVLNYRRKDAFELLSLQTSASVTEIQDAYLELARKLAPWQFEAPLTERARDVFLAAARAFAELLDPERRQAIIDRRARPAPKAEPEATRDQFRIHTTLLDPEVQFRRGKTLMNAGEYEKAIVQLEYAVDLDSQSSVYRAELAYCRFLSAPATGAARALAELNDTIRIDPRCGLAMLYAGEIYRRMGRLDEAEAWLERAIKPMAPDRRPIEALRTLVSQRKGRR
jgi:tetratricopeptide (TPR) repeat protein